MFMKSEGQPRMIDLPYRPGVGVMLLNGQGLVFVGQRIDNTAEAWQMPQGGIDESEDPRDTALRVLEEETGIHRELVAIIAEPPGRVAHYLTDDPAGHKGKGRYDGTRENC